MIDRDSESWRDVEHYLKSAIQRAQNELASPALDWPMTQYVRGRLIELQKILDLPAAQRAQQEPVFILKPGEIY